MKIKINLNNESCWCCYCKNRIEIGEKYLEDIEDYLDEKIKKQYHTECAPDESEEDDVYLGNNDENFPENGDLG